MALVETESGRVYLLELGKVVLEEMAPKMTSGVSPEIMGKLAQIAKNRSVDDINEVPDEIVMDELGMSPEEWAEFTKQIGDADEIGPDVLNVCMRKVDGMRPEDIINPVTDEPYGTIQEFIDRDEDFVDDIPELMAVVSKKLSKYYGGLLSQGELRGSFRGRMKTN